MVFVPFEMYHLLLLFALYTLGSFGELTAKIRPVEPWSATVLLELTNSAPYTVALLKWNLPLDDRFVSDSFRVLLNGSPVEYIGPVVKFAGPTLLDYVFFTSNETKTYQVALENAYDFSKPGTYDVVFRLDVIDWETEDDFWSLPHTRTDFTPYTGIISNSLVITTTVGLPQMIVRAPYPCSSSETNQINSAASNQKTMIGYAVSAIGQGNTASYVEWFGAYTASRYNTATTTINRINQNTVVAYRCDNQAGVYAYVYPTDTTHTIYLCSAFWPAPVAGGFDTKAGTLIHELSHFNNIGATRDYAYGTTAARNLARNNPNQAVANADNYEYFSESQW